MEIGVSRFEGKLFQTWEKGLVDLAIFQHKDEKWNEFLTYTPWPEFILQITGLSSYPRAIGVRNRRNP